MSYMNIPTNHRINHAVQFNTYQSKQQIKSQHLNYVYPLTMMVSFLCETKTIFVIFQPCVCIKSVLIPYIKWPYRSLRQYQSQVASELSSSKGKVGFFKRGGTLNLTSQPHKTKSIFFIDFFFLLIFATFIIQSFSSFFWKATCTD